jgi:cytochrome P450
MSDLTFGEPLHLLQHQNPKYAPWIAAVFNSLQAGVIFRSLRYWPTLYRFFRFILGKKLREKRREQFKFCADHVDVCLTEDPENTRPDFWSLILRQKEEDRLSLAEMHTNSSAFMMAGTETTTSPLSGLTYYLLTNPDQMEKRVTEIRSNFQSEEEMTIGALQLLEYLQSCLDEALRVYPPSMTGFQRRTPPSGAEICGSFVSGNVSSLPAIIEENIC